MRWQIEPFVGLGPLEFGMTRSDVAKLNNVIGDVTAADRAFDGSLNEFRTMDVPVCNYVEDRLSTIDTNWRVNDVFYKEMNVYKTEPEVILKFLENENGGALIGLGFVLFGRIGVNAAGFYDAETDKFYDIYSTVQDHRGLAVFRRGAFDELLNEFHPISFLHR